jgi:Pro-kumamolisin, activation domain/Bacterial Ig-like domain (group 3)
MSVALVRPFALITLALFSSLTVAQTAPRILITKPVDENQRTVLKGNTHPLARAEFDQGAAPADLPMNRMLLVLKRSDEQESALRSLIDNQQDKASPNYHKWLTPEQFGKQFGPSDQDIAQVTSWLQSHGFQIAQVTKGRTVIEFSGTAAQVQEALHTSIHKYAVNGEEHWANSNDPQIPAALTTVVEGVESLNNFARKPMYHLGGVVSRSKSTGEMKPLQPFFTIPGNGCGVQSSSCYGVGPYDFATIYSVSSLWSATPAVDGTGETIAIVGETDINPQDVADFRNFFGLPALTSSQLNIIHNGPAPGILTNGEETESDLDVEWSSAVAKGATIDFVISESTETSAGIDLSAQYIIDNNLAPVISESYGLCELGLGTAGNVFYSQLWQQAASQGITVFISSGDSGSAGCDSQDSSPPAPSSYGLAVSGLASTPYNVAVGGTDFNDLTNASTYWSLSNNSATQASALSYIPETTWNDSCTNSVFGSLLGFSASAETNCNNPQLSGFVVTVGGAGGKSNCTSSNGQQPATCAGGYPKPSWQTGLNVPADNVRDIPDVSLFAAAGSPSGSFYIICEADQVGGNSCNPANSSTNFLGIGGTSASAPAFAGIMALVNQKTNSRQGNANYVFYKLAAHQPDVFNDVATGTIAMPCQRGSINCTTATAGDQYGVLSGYATGVGYDLATGLGSVNVANLVNKWNTVSFNASTTTMTSLAPTTITHGQAVNVSVKVAGNSGTPTGSVVLYGGASGTQFVDSHALDNTGTATWTSALLPGGSYSVKAHYAGDGNYGSSDSAASAVTVNKESSSAKLQLITFDPNTGQIINSNATSALYGSPYLLRVNVLNSAGAACSGLQTACPSGTVTLTDNGAPVDGGTFTLNSLGYLEDQTIQLSGGVNSLQAGYAGDNSFNTSAPAVDAITITPAPTTMATPAIYGSVAVGSQLLLQITVQSSGTGAAPTGTVSFFINGTRINGTISYQGTSGSITNPNPILTANFTSSSSPFSAAGNYVITASYSGDSNYGSAASPSEGISVKYPAPLLSMSSPGITVAPGASVTVSAIIDTNLKNAPVPTGNVAFIYWGPMSPVNGTETYATSTDANGNVVLQASMTFVAVGGVSITASYNGDANYPAAAGGGLTDITVTGSDFALIPSTSSLNVMRGGGGTVLIYIAGQSNYVGTISFSGSSCSGLPAETTCNFAPLTVIGAGYTGIGINTTAPRNLSAYQKQPRTHVWAFAAGMPFAAALLLIGFPSRNRRKKIRLLLMAVLLIGVGCGGGSSSGGASNTGGGAAVQTDPGTPVGTYTITVTATSGSLSHTATFTLIVQ